MTRPRRKRDRWYIDAPGSLCEGNLAAIRAIGRCCWCGKRCPCDVHHIFAKGMGGNKPPGDSWINLVPVGASATLECPCHTKIHGSLPPMAARFVLVHLVAARENVHGKDIFDALFQLQCCTKDTTPEELLEKGLLKWVSRFGTGRGAPGRGTTTIDKKISGSNVNVDLPF
jgi:hypothetical protein